MNSRNLFFLLMSGFVLLLSMFSSCRDRGPLPPQQPEPQYVSLDSELFKIVTQTQPFSNYTLFPHADTLTTGMLNGSTAHRPFVRVSMNSIALGALRDGRYGVPFPDGSIIFKEIKNDIGATILYAVIFKESRNPLARNGWLWAEYNPNGSVVFSISTRGVNCIECHSREQGPQHDFVRTFERQR